MTGTQARQPDEGRRIAVDAQALLPDVTGVQRAVYELIRHLPAVGAPHEFIVYHPRGAPLPELPNGARVTFRPSRLPTRLRTVRIAWQQAALPRCLRADGVELLHAPTYTAPLFTDTPYVLTIYDLIALHHPEYSKRLNVLHYRCFLARSARRARRIIVPSRLTERHVLVTLNVAAENVRVIPLGVSEEFRPVTDAEALRRARERLGLPERYILFVGNIEPKKNLVRLIEAYAEAHRSGRIAHRLVLAGAKGWRCAEVFAAARRLSAAGIVHLPGRVPPALLPAVYSGADLFVMPSLTEGFGLPPLEAMACGTPVITSDAAALPEVVGDAALTVPPEDGRQIRIALEKVLANEYLARKLRALGLERAAKFSWRETARKTVAVYDEVIAEAEKDRAL